PRASCRSDRSALLAPAPETGGSWLAAGCASISRWNAKIRPTHHARSGRLGADVGARRTPLRVRRLHVSSHMGSSHMGIWALIRIIRSQAEWTDRRNRQPRGALTEN